MKGILRLVVLSVLCAAAYADSVDKSSTTHLDLKKLQATTQHCTQNQKEYDRAISRITKTEVFKQLEANLNPQYKIVFGGALRDQPVSWKKQCYLSVSTYIDHGDRLELRQVFLVTRDVKTVYVEQLNGNYKRLKTATN